MFGLAAGGLVVPGYIALYLDKPVALLSTVAASFVTFGLIRFLSYFIFIFGRRRMVLTILLGFMAGWGLRSVSGFTLAGMPMDLAPVGYIIPGLISNWMDRQGILPTLATMIIAAVIVRLLIIIISGGAFFTLQEGLG